MSYPETVRYLESLINYEKTPHWSYKQSLKLERFQGFLKNIGNPQLALRCIHIAGTKGKGSTCAFIAYILREAGFKVGLYTSPHLSDFKERIRILSPQSLPCRQAGLPCRQAGTVRRPPHKREFEGMIPRSELTLLVEKLKPTIENYNKNSPYGPLSFFEVYTALAFVYFKDRRVDFAVLETGMGGRLDATNTIEPLVCAITPISYEHTQKLGDTLTQIAGEKTGIIKAQSSKLKAQKLIVITAPQERESLIVIRKRCQKMQAKLYQVGKDITYRQARGGFEIRGILRSYPRLKIRLLGEHQFINAAVAIGVMEALHFQHIDIALNSIRKGLFNTVWPGRCEVVTKDPLVVLDGAQNVASAHVLKMAVRKNFYYRRLILVLGISGDKDKKGICRELGDLANEIILTQANNPRASRPKELVKYFPGKEVRLTRDVKEAKKIALAKAEKKDLILVCGSLFVVGEFRDD